MIIEFASKNPGDVDKFLTGDNFKYLSDETRDHIRSGVRDGLCRVRDPFMYGGSSGIVPEEGVDVAHWKAFRDELQRYHDQDIANRPQPVTLTRGDLPDGFHLEWGERLILEDAGKAHIAWWGTGEWDEENAREANYGGYWRIVGPAHAIPGTNAPDDDHIETATDAEVAAEKERMKDNA